MSSRAAMALGVVAAVLFVALVAVGVGRDEGSSEDSNPFVDGLAGLVADPAAVAVDDIEVITSGCVGDPDEPDRLTFGGVGVGSCELAVERERGLGLVRILAENEFRVVAPAPGGDLRVRVDAAAGDEVTVAVGEGRTEIVLVCRRSSCEAVLHE